MRILFGFLIVLLLAIPSHAYFPPHCNHADAAADFRDADTVVIGQVSGFERVMEVEKGKHNNGKEYTLTTFSYFAKIQIARAVTGKLKEGEEILVFEGYGEQWRGERFAQSHWLKQCMTHPQAGMQLGTAYILALNAKEGQSAPKHWYQLRSCHKSMHEIANVVNEDGSDEGFGVKIRADDDGKKPEHYVIVDAYIEHMKKLAAKAPSK